MVEKGRKEKRKKKMEDNYFEVEKKKAKREGKKITV